MNIQLLLTGNELMTGVTIDSNSARVAQSLSKLGLIVTAKTTVGDEFEQLVSELKRLAKSADLIIMNGGLGPTVDDLTARAVARAANVEIVLNDDAMTHLITWCDAGNARVLNDANRKQAHLPAGCEILPNSRGSAVGFRIELDGCLICCTPGPPSELQAMLSDYIMPLLAQRFADAKSVRQSRYHLFGIGESRMQQWMSDKFPDWPEQIDLGFRAGLPTLEIKLTSSGSDMDGLHDEWRDKLVREVSGYIVSTGDENLQTATVNLLRKKQKRITTVESCTGGLIASMLTSVAGASDVFDAGFVTYSNQMKNKMVGTSECLLETHGAVSEQVARAMVAGGLAVSGADIGVAVTGIAGPDGGSEDKPVGTVWVSWGYANNIHTQKFFVPARRHVFQSLVAALALDLIRREIMHIAAAPDYFSP